MLKKFSFPESVLFSSEGSGKKHHRKRKTFFNIALCFLLKYNTCHMQSSFNSLSTANPLLSLSGGLFISSTFKEEGGGGLIK